MFKLPENGILLHIGAPKTGTTSIQRACFRKKSELRELGILYPGDSESHNWAVARPAGYPDDWMTPPDLSFWQALVAEVRAETQKVIVSSELLSNAGSNEAQHIVEELGIDRVHILLTIRPLAFLMPSIWQQDIKSGDTEPLDIWMREVLRGPYADRERIFSPWIMADFADAVRRWKNVVGANKFFVLMVEPNHPDKLIHDFEDLLSLPQGFLAGEDGKPENRSLTYHEAEFVRHINMRKWGNELPNELSLTYPLSVIRKFTQRVPCADEERLRLPTEMLEKIVVFAKEMRDQIAETGVNIIGDINCLMKVPPPIPEGSVCGSDIETISKDMVAAMVEAILKPTVSDFNPLLRLAQIPIYTWMRFRGRRFLKAAPGANIISEINSHIKVPSSKPEGNACGSEVATISMDKAVSMVETILKEMVIALNEANRLVQPLTRVLAGYCGPIFLKFASGFAKRLLSKK